MTVKEFESRVSAYVEGELSPVEMATMERKVAECEYCRALLADVRTLIERVKELPKVRPSAEFVFALRSRLLMEGSKKRRGLHEVLFSSATRTITTLAAAVVIGLGLTQVVVDSDVPPMAVKQAEIPLAPGKQVDVGALELERLSEESHRLDGRHVRDSMQVDSLRQRPSNVRDQHRVRQVPVSYSF